MNELRMSNIKRGHLISERRTLHILPPRQMVPYTAYMSTWKQIKFRYSVAL